MRLDRTNDLELIQEFGRRVRCVAGQSTVQGDCRNVWGLTQGRSMADHGLEVGIIVDLDIDWGGGGGGRESDRIARGNASEETVPVPGCLPLGIAS